MAHLREIGMEGGREAEEETRMRKKIEVKEWGNTSANRMKRVACLSARRSGKGLSEEEK